MFLIEIRTYVVQGWTDNEEVHRGLAKLAPLVNFKYIELVQKTGDSKPAFVVDQLWASFSKRDNNV